MGLKPVYECTKRDAQRLARDVKKGDVLYTIENTCERVHGYEDKQLYSRHVVTHRSVITGSPMVAGSLSVQGLLHRFGPVYTQPPARMRGQHEPVPQVAGPLGGNAHGRPLSRAEITQLESYVAELDEAEAAPKKQPALSIRKWF
ncbi:hypothetical protein ACIRD2_03125 [Streptomyces sp. NPDC093595]|uniref:hypothetical protein n=1 Tax=Streptomyces sp. NPDC093595 TaxID=3366045 RepID=UPI00381CFDA5